MTALAHHQAATVDRDARSRIHRLEQRVDRLPSAQDRQDRRIDQLTRRLDALAVELVEVELVAERLAVLLGQRIDEVEARLAGQAATE